jgi:hypothetical protein
VAEVASFIAACLGQNMGFRWSDIPNSAIPVILKNLPIVERDEQTEGKNRFLIAYS